MKTTREKEKKITTSCLEEQRSWVCGISTFNLKRMSSLEKKIKKKQWEKAQRDLNLLNDTEKCRERCKRRE